MSGFFWFDASVAVAQSGQYALTATTDTLVVSGITTGATAARTLPTTTLTYSVASVATGLNRGFLLPTTTQPYDLTSVSTSWQRGCLLAASVRTYTASTVAAGTLYGRVLPSTTRSYAATGVAASLLVGRVLGTTTAHCFVNGAPPQPPTPWVWYTGNDVTMDGSNHVTQLTDISGHGRHAPLVDSANVFVRDHEAWGGAGYIVVGWDGLKARPGRRYSVMSSSLNSLTGFDIPGISGWTAAEMYMVHAVGDNDFTHWQIGDNIANYDNWGCSTASFFTKNGANEHFDIGLSFADGPGRRYERQPVIVRHVNNGDGTLAGQSLASLGGSLTTQGVPWEQPWLEGTHLSGGTLNNAGDGFDGTPVVAQILGHRTNGTFSEVLLYDRVLSTEERAQVDAYLNSQYGVLTNPASPPAKLYAQRSLSTTTATVSVTANTAGVARTGLTTATVTTYDVTTVDATLTKETPATNYPLTTDTAAYTVSGVSAGTAVTRALAAAPAGYSITSVATGLLRGLRLPTDTRTLAVASGTAGLLAQRKSGATVTTYAVSSVATGLIRGRYLGTTTRALTLTTVATGLNRGRYLATTTQSIAVAGVAAALNRGRYLATTTGALVETPVAAALLAARIYSTTTTPYAASTVGALLRKTGFQKLLIDSAAFAVTPVAASLNRGWYLAGATQTVTLTRNAAALNRGRYLATTVRTYAATPVAAGMLRGRYLGTTVRSLALTGLAPTALKAARKTPGATNAFSLGLGTATFNRGRLLTGAVRTYAVASVAAGLIRGRYLGSTASPYVVTVGSAGGLIGRHLDIGTTAFTVASGSATLVRTGLINLAFITSTASVSTSVGARLVLQGASVMSVVATNSGMRLQGSVTATAPVDALVRVSGLLPPASATTGGVTVDGSARYHLVAAAQGTTSESAVVSRFLGALTGDGQVLMSASALVLGAGGATMSIIALVKLGHPHAPLNPVRGRILAVLEEDREVVLPAAKRVVLAR